MVPADCLYFNQLSRSQIQIKLPNTFPLPVRLLNDFKSVDVTGVKFLDLLIMRHRNIDEKYPLLSRSVHIELHCQIT